MNILVPVQYPLTEANRRAIRHGQNLTKGGDETELLILALLKPYFSDMFLYKTAGH